MLETRKVYYLPGAKEEVPYIKLTGKWLQELGFNVGDTIQIVKGKDIIILMKPNEEELKQQI